MEDEQLIKLVLRGDHAAFRKIVERYAPVLMGYLKSKISSYVDREEIIQEVFLSAYTDLEKLRDTHKLGPWLIGIAKNKAKGFHRQNQHHGNGACGSTHALCSPEAYLEKVVDTAPDPGKLAHAKHIGEAISEAIGQLDDRYRTVLYLKLIHEYTTKEVAHHLNLRESTVRMRFMRGLKKLRKCLTHHGVVPLGELCGNSDENLRGRNDEGLDGGIGMDEEVL